MGVQERKAREKAGREQAILAAAKTVFLRQGLLVATLDDIAAEAELSKGTLYRYYRSKEDLLLALHELALRELHTCFVAAASAGSGRDRLLRMGRAYYTFVVANPVYFEFIAFFSSPLTTASSLLLDEALASIHAFTQSLWAAGVADGSIRRDLRADLMANTLWASAYGMLQFIASREGSPPTFGTGEAEALFDAYLATIDWGLRP